MCQKRSVAKLQHSKHDGIIFEGPIVYCCVLHFFLSPNLSLSLRLLQPVPSLMSGTKAVTFCVGVPARLGISPLELVLAYSV